ncbi:MAG TPA: PspC domain-containing protein [Sphingomicrobium sp.]|nr:PspC domain-containing protein [Sphingomicrobium sp.]
MSAQSVPSNEYVSLPARPHTILGVCEGIGEDFGFNPIFLRIPLAVMVIWSPLVAFSTYFALGAVVLAARLLFPGARATADRIGATVDADNDRVEAERIAA